MDYSEIIRAARTYLGFKGADGVCDNSILTCLEELSAMQSFNCVSESFSSPPDFLNKEPYISFIQGCEKVVLCVTTLGAEADRRLKYLSKTDMYKSVVFDAAASAYLEYLADEHEKKFGNLRTYRFCPGYGGSSVEDLKYIFELLRPEKIGVTLSDTFFMLPSKSMAGIIGIGKKLEKTCGECFLKPHCKYLKEGARCYGSAKKS